MKTYRHKVTKHKARLIRMNANKDGVWYYLVFSDNNKAWFPKKYIDRDFEEITT